MLFDKRYRTEYAKWEQRQYQPTKGPVYHIRNKNYIPREREGTITPFNDLIENAEAPYAGGVVHSGGEQTLPSKEKMYMRIGKGPRKSLN